MNKTDQARRRAAEQELAAIRDMLLAGQEDDDGGQIVPDFEEGMTVYAMVAACLHLLERRRDVIDASAKIEAENARLRNDLAFSRGMTIQHHEHTKILTDIARVAEQREIVLSEENARLRTAVEGAIAWHAKRADVHDTHQMLEHDEQANRLRNAIDPNWRIALEEARGK